MPCQLPEEFEGKEIAPFCIVATLAETNAIESKDNMNITGTINDAINELKKYHSLESIIDTRLFKKRVSEKYPDAQMREDETFDLYTALIFAKNYPQAMSNAATPEGALRSIDAFLARKDLGNSKQALARKLLNLRSTSLWDTLTEVLLCETLASNVPVDSLRVDYPLDPTRPKSQSSKDADIAILDASGSAKFLIEAITPELNKHSKSVKDQIVACIEKKYQNKFAEYCREKRARNAVIAVSVFKSEEQVYPVFVANKIQNQIYKLSDSRLDALPGLAMAIVCSFRCPDQKTLVIDHIAQYTASE